MMTTTFLVGMVAAAAALHRHLQWYWIGIYVVSSFIVFPVASLAFCFIWAQMMEKISMSRDTL